MFKLAQTQIVPSSLKDGSLERKRDHCSQEGDVALTQLILQIDCMCADHHLLVRTHAMINSRQQVAQRFAGAGTRFNQQMLFFLKGGLYFADHYLLCFPRLILR
ncbi:hypothetical protein D3C80_1992050 [compost metagenome]